MPRARLRAHRVPVAVLVDRAGRWAHQEHAVERARVAGRGLCDQRGAGGRVADRGQPAGEVAGADRGPPREVVDRGARGQTEQHADAARCGLRAEVRAGGVGFGREREHVPIVVAERAHLGEVEGEGPVERAAQLGDPGHLLVDARRGAVGLVEAGRALQDTAAEPAEWIGDREELPRVRERAGHPAAVGHAVGERTRDRVPERARLERRLHLARHRRELVVGGAPVRVAGGVAEDVGAERDVTDVPAGVDALGQAVDDVEVLGVGLPGPREPVEDARRRDVLDRLHRTREDGRRARPHRGERHPAVPHDHRRHAVPARRRHEGVPPDLRVEVGVEVDEPGRDEPPVGVDRASGRARVAGLGDGGDAVAVDRDVGASARRAGTVDDRPVGDDEVVGHECSVRSTRSPRASRRWARRCRSSRR